MVIKLDMEKAYDRMSREFIYAVFRIFGFSEEWIDIVHRLISNVRYSIMVMEAERFLYFFSGSQAGGDPLSTPIFIIGSEVLSRLLNRLNQNENITNLSMNSNDVVIFTRGNKESIKLVMKQISIYEKASGQKANTNKSLFITAPKTSAGRINRMRENTGFIEKQLPFVYLGCPIYMLERINTAI